MRNEEFHICVPSTLDARGVATLQAALSEAARQQPRVVVLSGSDGVFCQGMDLAAATAESDPDGPVHSFARCLEALCNTPSPTLGVIDGLALGGGLGLSAACDAVLATERSTFGLPELLFGLLPAVVLPVLLQRVQHQKLRLLALRGHTVTAAEARQLGLVDDVVAADMLPRATRRWIRVLSRPDPAVVAAFKAYVAEAARLEPHEALARGASLTAQRLHVESVRASVRQFAAHAEEVPWRT